MIWIFHRSIRWTLCLMSWAKLSRLLTFDLEKITSNSFGWVLAGHLSLWSRWSYATLLHEDVRGQNTSISFLSTSNSGHANNTCSSHSAAPMHSGTADCANQMCATIVLVRNAYVRWKLITWFLLFHLDKFGVSSQWGKCTPTLWFSLVIMFQYWCCNTSLSIEDAVYKLYNFNWKIEWFQSVDKSF